MAKQKEKDLKYKVFTVRLQEETKEWLKLRQKQSGTSWNKFIIKLLKTHENKN